MTSHPRRADPPRPDRFLPAAGVGAGPPLLVTRRDRVVNAGQSADKGPRKPLACRLGFHSVYGNTTGVNVGTDKTPIYMMETEERCNRCDWRGGKR